MMKHLVFLLAFCLSLMTTSCGGMLNGKKAAEQGVADFHATFNDGNLRDIYGAAHEKLKAASSEKDFLEFIATVRKKLGKVTSTKTFKFDIRSIDLVTTVVLVQSTNFEHGVGTETFTFEIKREKAVLVGYFINSKDLVLK
ncbi:MAG: hypothetical protein JWN25_60 [Verrucomicrobiales bacterium]|nr:hypothetical protein [Verrucomicrobiales bacterium]